MRNSYLSIAKLLPITGLLIIASFNSFSQCVNAVSNGSSIGLVPCGTFATVGVGSGTYQEFTGLLSGASYTFETCGTPFNSNLSATNNSNTAIAGGFGTSDCGDDGSITLTTFTPTTRIHVNGDACVGWVGGQGSAILSYRQNNNLVFTSSSADMCPGNTRNLTATPAGGTFSEPSGTVSGTLFTAPTTTGPYVITYQYGQCSVTQTINVVSPSVDPSSVVASPSTVCPGGGTTLSVIGGSLGLGASWTWYAGGCGSGSPIGTGTSIAVSPSTTTTYYVRAEGGCNTTLCASVQVTVNTVSTAPTSITATNLNVCSGTSTTLSVNGGTLGSGAQWLWYIGSCGGQLVGGGSSITVSPQSTANYFVLASGPCNTTTCASVVITVTPSPSVGFSNIQSPSGCGASDGTISATASGGTPPYTYSWLNGPSGPNAQTYAGLPAGPYFVTITDANGCSDQATISMDDPGASQVSIASSDADNIICSGETVTFTGSGAFQYTYFVGSTSVSTANPWVTNSLVNGDQVTVVGVDFNFCSSTSQTLTYTVNPNPFINATVTDPSACGASDGSITTVVSSGQPSYSYLWTGGNANGLVTPDVTGLAAGPYLVTVTDQNGCSTNGTYGLSDPGAAPVTQVSSEDPTNVICAGESVTFTASGSNVYEYFVDAVSVGSANPYTTTTLTNGQSVVPTGTDANGCTATGTPIIIMTVNPGPLITLVSNVPNETICVGQDISFFASGGMIYEFFVGPVSQGPPSSTSLFIGSGLQNGDVVSVIGTDANGCDVQSAALTVTVNPSPVVTIINQSDPSACGASDGSVTADATGGTGSFVYEWTATPPVLTATYSGLMAGSYFVTATDDAGCVATASASLSDVGSSPVTLGSDYPSGIVCGGVPVTFTSTGATTYVYYVNGVQTSSQNPFVTDSLQDGDIIAVTGYDSLLCAATSFPVQFTIYPEVQIGIVSSLNPSGCQATDGAATTITIGGTPGYIYGWTPSGQSNANASGLSAGVHTVTVTDANGCADSDIVSLSDIGADIAYLTADPDNLIICAGTEIEFTATGSNTYEFYVDQNPVTTVSPYVTSSIQDGETVTLIATDVNGCIYTTPGLTYQVNPAPAVTFTSVGPVCSNIEVYELTGGSPAGGTYTVNYEVGNNIFPITGNLFFPTLAVPVPVPSVPEIVDIDYDYEDVSTGCVGTASTTITVNPAPAVDLGNDTAACVYTLDAGAGFISYLWSPSSETTPTIQTFETNSYSVRVEDANGCFGFDTILVDVNPLPTPFLPDTVSFCVGNTVTITAELFYQNYTWSGPGTSVFNVYVTDTEGPVTLDVEDANGCVGSAEVYVEQNEPMAVSALTVIGDEPFCYGGSVIIDSEPGYASYLWNTGSVTRSITVTQSGSYWLTTLDGNGCIDSSLQTAPIDILVWNPFPQVAVVADSLIVTDPQNYVPNQYQWFLNGDTIPGATGEFYVINPTGSGNYHVMGTDVNGCTGNSLPIEMTCCTGISEAAFDGSVNVYPNPNNGQFIVDITMKGTRAMTVELHDMVGKIIWTDGSIGTTDQVHKQYDVKELPNGVYFLRVTADTQMSVVKLIKQ